MANQELASRTKGALGGGVPSGPSWEEVFAYRLSLTGGGVGLNAHGNRVKAVLFGVDSLALFGGIRTTHWTGAKTPEAVNLAWDNAETFARVWGDYPGPAETWVWLKAMLEFHGHEVRAIVYGPEKVAAPDAKLWTTLTFYADYPRMADRINAIIQKEIRQDARRAVTQAIAVGAVGLLLGGVLTGGALSLATKGMDQLKAQQKKDVARGMKELADSIRDGAPAFAAEVDRVAGIYGGPEIFMEPPGPTIPPPPPPPPDPAKPTLDKMKPAPNGLLIVWSRLVAWLDRVLT